MKQNKNTIIFFIFIAVVSFINPIRGLISPSYLHQLYAFVPSWYTPFIVVSTVFTLICIYGIFVQKKRFWFVALMLGIFVNNATILVVFRPNLPVIYVLVPLILLVIVITRREKIWKHLH